MTVVNMLDAKTRLSRLVEAVESGAETEIIIARNGRPAAKLVAVSKAGTAGKRLGLLAGRFPPLSQSDFDTDNDAIAAMLRGEGS